VTIAAFSAVVAGAIPTHAVADRQFGIPVITRDGFPAKPSLAGAVPLIVSGHQVTVTAPVGYTIVQLGIGEPSNAHVTLAPTDGPGDTMVVRFAAPTGIRVGAIIGVHGGTPVRETRFGTLWRSSLGVIVLVTGSSQAAQLAAIDGVRIAP
jgi:hypothetical protein